MDTKISFASFAGRARSRDRDDYDSYGPIDLITGRGDDDVEDLNTELDRLQARVIELEERIRREVPRSGALTGERISLLLQTAEETAADTVTRAEAHANRLQEKAERALTEADDQARSLISRAEEQARRIEATARAEAAEIEAEAEARAGARTRDIERWAQEVVSHTRAEEARMLREHEEQRRSLAAQLEALAAERDAAADNLVALRSSLADALQLIGGPLEQPAPAPETSPATGTAPSTAPDAAAVPSGTALHEAAPEDIPAARPQGDVTSETAVIPSVQAVDEEMPWPAPSASADIPDGAPSLVAASDEFDAKIDAWVAEGRSTDSRPAGGNGARHFRR